MDEDDRVPFTLNYNSLLEMNWFRKGSSIDPFPREFTWMTSEEYGRFYENSMSNSEGPQSVPDFIVNGSKEIIYKENSGNMLRKLSIFSTMFQNVLLNILGPSMEHSRIF